MTIQKFYYDFYELLGLRFCLRAEEGRTVPKEHYLKIHSSIDKNLIFTQIIYTSDANSILNYS